MNSYEQHFPEAFYNDWESPNPIRSKIPPVERMAEELMPIPLKGWISDVCHRMQTPADFATVSAIIVFGSVIGSGCAIRPKRIDDWEVIPNIWGACIGLPSVVLKTPSMQEVIRLLDRLQTEYGEAYEKEKALFEADDFIRKSELKDVESRITKLAKGSGKTGTVDADAMAVLRNDYARLKAETGSFPARRLFKTNETSIQSMTVLQEQNERGLLVFRDELTGLLVRWDREDHADERAYYLEGWNGNGSYTDMKISRGLTDAKNICISMLGGIQPDKLQRYLAQAMSGNNDGLMQRLQLAVWPDIPKDWKLIDTQPNRDEKEKAYKLLTKLADMDFHEAGARQSEPDDRPYFRFDSEAQEVFNDWLTELQTVKIKNEDNPLMVEHFGKFRSLMPSLALIFHCISIANDGCNGGITVESALLAVEWCKYLESHARRIYSIAGSPEFEAAITLSKHIESRKLQSPFTAKTVYAKGWYGLKNRNSVEAACDILIDENWLNISYPVTNNNSGRPPLPRYFINPAFL